MLGDAITFVSAPGQEGWPNGGRELPVEQLLPPLRQRLAIMDWVGDADPGGDLSSAGWVIAKRGMVEDWQAWVEPFLRRLRADREKLARWLRVEELPGIVTLGASASEAHGGVIRVGFEGGKGIFYKARPVTGELLWAELNDVVARFDGGAAVVTAQVLEGGTGVGAGGEAAYGWMEELASGECGERTHWRQAGVLLCLAAHVGLSDLQMSNVVATSGGPAVVDAECLGQCRGGSERDEGALERMLLDTGLLPETFAGASEIGVVPDVSGLFGGAAPVDGVVVPVWKDGTVAMAAVRLLEQKNRPRTHRLPLACLPEMLEGYLRAARALDAVRPELLANGGWVARLGRMHSPRLVLRSTLAYGLMLSESLFPEPRHGNREQRLRKALTGTNYGSGGDARSEVLEAELEALLRLRIPRFHVARGSQDLLAEDKVVAEDAVPATVEAGVRRRLETICLDAERVQAALASVLFHAQKRPGRKL